MGFVRIQRVVAVWFLSLACVISAGCMAGRGVRMTRQPFNEAAQYTAKEEMLLNIVRLKYCEPPEFMALSSINQSLSYSGGSSAFFSPFTLGGWDINGSVSESPNFTYSPLESDEFNRRLINPIPRDVLDLLGATNWSPGHLLRITVKNINDVDNASNAGGPTPKTAPEFVEFKIAMDILDQLRESRQVEMTHVSDEDNIGGITEKRHSRDKLFGEMESSPTGSESSFLQDPTGLEFGAVEPHSRGTIAQASFNAQVENDPQTILEIMKALQGLTKSELEVQLNRLSDDQKSKMLVDKLAEEMFAVTGQTPKELSAAERKVLEDLIAKNVAVADQREELEGMLRAGGADPTPFAQKLFKQIRDGLAPDAEEAASGSDQLVLRFEAETLEYPEVENFQQIFNLVGASEAHPFYNIHRADWGQLRRRDQFKKARKQDKLWISPRSFLEVMYFLSQGIDIPQEHYQQGLVTRTLNPDGTCFNWSDVTGDLLNVCVSKRRPKCASTAVQYRGYWYYIKDNDLESKSTFSLITQIYNMSVRSGAVGVVPQLTITR